MTCSERLRGRSGALGMIEVYGMLGAIEAADAALKAASVSLLRAKRVRGGLVTVLLTGDVAAVRSAVDAAVASLGRLGRPCSSHVIPRLSSEVALMLAEDEGVCPRRGEGYGAQEPEADTAAKREYPDRTGGESGQSPDSSRMTETEVAEEPEDDGDETDEDDESEISSWSGEPPELENLTVMELRRLARNLGLRTMSKKQIRFAGKAELIRELTAFLLEKRGESE